MEQQVKISRSRARHLRRKKLINARKEAGNNTLNAGVEINGRIKLQKLSNNELSAKENEVTTDKKSNSKSDADKKSVNQEKKNNSVKRSRDKVSLECNKYLNQESLNLSRESQASCSKSDYNDSLFSTLEEIVTKLNSISFPSLVQSSETKMMNTEEKTREQIKGEREARKAAKATAKKKSINKSGATTINKTFVVSNVDSKGKSKEDTVTYKEPKETNSKEVKSKQKNVNFNFELSDSISNQDYNSIKQEEKNIMKNSEKIQSCNAVEKPFPNRNVSQQMEEKSKAQLRAERRAKQEAQRAAKQEKAEKQAQKVIQEKIKVKQQTSDLIKQSCRSVSRENSHEVNLFKHLYHEREISLATISTLKSKIHPEIMRLGVEYASKIIVGSNARCIALLCVLKHLVKDFERPPQADFSRGLEAILQNAANYLHYCRPLAVSMQNALKHLKWQILLLSATIPEEEAKQKLYNIIDTYIQERIILADKTISRKMQTKISKGDVILTYGFSSLIHKILCDAHAEGQQFQVVVVDGRPCLEGIRMLKRLVKQGIECSYILINALSFIMPKVSKVFLGAHAILANGSVMSRVGNAQIALMAKAFNVPVLVACETHKSCERAQTDSIVYNEIGDADALTETFLYNPEDSPLVNWRNRKSLNLLNITYDVTPADLVTAVVTELAILPPSSVPVILRIKPSEV